MFKFTGKQFFLLFHPKYLLLVLFIESDKKEKSPKKGDNKGKKG
jgi:hypothetical protein